MKLLRIIAWLAIGPAIYVNMVATPMPWTPFAIGSVILAAAFVYLAWEKRSFWFGSLGAVFTLINLATALGNVASMSAEAIDGRSSTIERKQDVNARRARLNAARKAQVVLAGEASAQTIEGQLQALIASDAPRWTASDRCNPDKITQPATRTLCDQIAKAQAKKAAALKRDEIDAKLAEVDKETVFGGPSSADPYAESLARFLSMFGYQPTEEGKVLLSASKDWGKAIGLELMAAFGPMGLTALFELLLLGSHAAPLPASGEGRSVVEHKPVPVLSIPLSAVPHVEAPRAASAAMMIEPDEDKPAPLPPSTPPKHMKRRKPKVTNSCPGATVIPFKKQTQGEVLALKASGKTQKEIAAIFGCTDRTIRNILSGNRRVETAISLPA